MRRPEILHDCDAVQVLRRQGRSDHTLLTFGPMHSRTNGMSMWGDVLCAKLDLTCVSVMPKTWHWYPEAVMKPLTGLVRAATEGPVIAYGTSMGGHAVLRYGRAMGATVGLAFVPQATIDPAIIGPTDKRYAAFFREDWHSGKPITARALPEQSFVFYDPFMRRDAMHAALLPRSKKITRIKLPFSGHRTVQLAASTRTAQQMFGFAQAGNAAALRALLLPRRRLEPEYFRQMALEFLTRKQPERAELVIRAGLDLHGSDVDLHRIRGRSFAQLGRIEDALEASMQARALRPGDRRVDLQLADIHLQAGQTDTAIALLEALPNRDHLVALKLVTAHEQAGAYDRAIAEMERALDLLPGHGVLQKRLTHLRRRAATGAEDDTALPVT